MINFAKPPGRPRWLNSSSLQETPATHHWDIAWRIKLEAKAIDALSWRQTACEGEARRGERWTMSGSEGHGIAPHILLPSQSRNSHCCLPRHISLIHRLCFLNSELTTFRDVGCVEFASHWLKRKYNFFHHHILCKNLAFMQGLMMSCNKLHVSLYIVSFLRYW